MVNYRTAQRRCQVPVLGKGFCCHSEEHHGDESHVYAPCLSRKTLRAYADPCVFRRLRNRAPACSSTLRCPENAAGLRFSLHSPTAAEIANLLLLPLAAQVRNSTGSGRGSVILSEPLGARRRIFSVGRGKILRLRGFAASLRMTPYSVILSEHHGDESPLRCHSERAPWGESKNLLEETKGRWKRIATPVCALARNDSTVVVPLDAGRSFDYTASPLRSG